MPTAPFAHLHVHTHYSLLDGACKVPELVKRAKALGMEALAITDHGCMFGVIEFYNECVKQGVKPLIGMEAYMAPGDRRERQAVGGETAYHMVLLAQNVEGYHNLLKLSSSAYREGFYYKPRIDKEILRAHSKGLIATSACLGGEIPSAFMKRDGKAAKTVAETYLEIFGPDRFFIEVQKQGIQEQDMVNPELVELAKKVGVGIVGTNDVHFLNKDDHFAHDVLCCISMGRLQSEEGRMKYPEHLYLKSQQEMAEIFAGLPAEAIENTGRVAAMCDLSLDFSKRYAPVYRVPPDKLREETFATLAPERMQEWKATVAGTEAPDAANGEAAVGPADGSAPPEAAAAPLSTPHSALSTSPALSTSKKDDELYLRQLCEDGLIWRYGTTDVSAAVRERLEKEIKVIAGKGFCSYFLIVWDFCNFARDNGIPVGARGSGVGTMVGYLLGLCNVDPIEYGLLFERFMDPSRSEMPDIDIDICQDGRGRVIDYVRQKYGHVAQIITFGTLAAKAVCKDVGRVMGFPLQVTDRITKLIPGLPGTTLDKAIKGSPELAELYGSDPQVKQIIDIGKRLEGLCRNAGCHAAGVIIADQPLDGIVPLYKDKDDNVLTQFEGPIAEKCGLLKMDFLGLRTLSVVTRAVDLVKKMKGKEVDVEKLDLTDKTVLDLFTRGETKGVFQFESGGMQDLLMKMRPDRVEDLIAANALYRPGPMELIPTYCARKHGREEVPKVHPEMDAILAETYGIMCIHEDARVALADGSEKPIRDVRKGDWVHSVNRADNRIEVKECHGCGPTRRGEGVRVVLENGFAVTLTPDHKVFTYDGMKEAGELDPETDLVMVGRHARQDRPTARHLAPWLGSDEDVAYLLGSLIGDGGMTGKGVSLATGREADHKAMVVWLRERLPTLSVHEYFHGRSWYVSLSHPALLSDPAHGNRKTRFHHLLDTLGLKVAGPKKRVPEVIFRCNAKVRAAFLAGLLDADGCTAVQNKGVGVCFFTSVSLTLLQDVRRLAQLEGIPVTLRSNRLQFWDLLTLSELLAPYLLVRRFNGVLTGGKTIGWVPRSVLHAAVPAGESLRAFSARTGIMRAGMRHSHPFVKSSTAAKAGIGLGDVRFHRIAKLERVADQQFYGMSVEGHHNLLADGIVVKNCYQEQVMQVFNQLGGIELSAAYKLIKAISKKMGDVIAKFRPEFLKGCVAKGVPEAKADEIFELILKFGGYGFNKSHSSRYAIVAFQTGFLKTYYPVEYMAALLTYEMGTTEKVVEYIEECRRMPLPDGTRGVKVLPPDINISDRDFTPVYVDEELPKGKKPPKLKKGELPPEPKKVGVIRFGLAAVRGVGEKAVDSITAERTKNGPFKNLYEFCERADLRAVTKGTLEALIKCGAFAAFGRRAALLQVLDSAVESGQRTQADKRNGQMSMFGSAQSSAAALPHPSMPDVDELPETELLKFEKELLGFYITSHPLTEHQFAMEHYSTSTTKDALTLAEGTEVTIGGMISRVKKVLTKNGRSAGMPMAILTMEDLEGQIDGTMFADTFADISARYPSAVAAESIVFVRGKVDRKRETPSLLINELIPVADAVAKLTTTVAIKLDAGRHTGDVAEQLEAVLKKHKGGTEVYLQVTTGPTQKVTMRLDRERFVKPTKDLVDDLEQLLGSGAAMMCGAGTKRARLKAAQQQPLFEGGDATAAGGGAGPDAEPAADAQAVLDAEAEDAELAEA